MTRLRQAAGAALTAVRRAVPDLLTLASLGALAYGLSFVHPALPWIALGLGGLAAVRYGAR